MSIKVNLQQIQQRIVRACERAGRNPNEIRLVAVTKNVPVARIEEALTSGVTTIGENRVQEAWEKYQALGDKVHWHLIGHLQTNKVKRTLDFCEMIQSVDRLELGNVLSRQAQLTRREIEILVEVNTSGETTKFGVAPDQTVSLVSQLAQLPGIKVTGLMTIGLFSADSKAVLACFQRLQAIFEQLKQTGIQNTTMRWLSMGMTDDFELAIQAGSNMVRIGRAIFGERIP
jgi:hypothetical protein